MLRDKRRGRGSQSTYTWRKMGVAFGLVAAVGPLAGCGSDSDSGGSGGSKAPIKIGYLTSLTGPIAGTYRDATIGFEARIAKQNAEGGVDGHKLEIIKGDDQSGAPAAQAAVRNLVQSKRVKVLAAYSVFTATVAPFLKAQGVPVIGTARADAGPEWTADGNFFSVDGSVDPDRPATNLSWGKWFKQHGATNVGFVGVNVQPVQADRKSVVASLDAAGLKTTYENSTIPLSQVSGFGGVVQSMVQQGVDGVKTSWTAAAGIAFLKDLDTAGARSKMKTIVLLGSPSTADLKSAEARKLVTGTWGTSPVVPSNADTPAAKAFMDAIAKYGNTSTPLNDHGVIGWLVASAVIRSLEEAGPDASSKDIIAKLRAVKDFDGDGMEISPLDFKASAYASAQSGIYPKGCMWFSQYDGREYKPEAEPTCGGLTTPAG